MPVARDAVSARPGNAAAWFRGLLGGVVGTVWFVAISGAAVAQHDAVATGHERVPAVLLVALVAVISALCAAGFRFLGTAWGWGVTAALAGCLLLGLIEGPIAPEQAPSGISLPATFSVGLGSLAVWVAFAMSLTLAVTASRKHGIVEDRDDSREPV